MKNQTIQIFRALAIIAVVLIHTCPLTTEWQIFFRPFVNFAVATFIFLSGYLTKAENDNWPNFFKKRIIRVIVPYVIWTLFYCIATKRWTPEAITFDLLTARTPRTFYFIFVYIQFVLLTPLMVKLARSRYQWIGWCVAPLSILLFWYYPLLAGFEFSEAIELIWRDAFLGWFTFYYLGLLLGNGIIVRHYKMGKLILLYAACILLNMAEGYWWNQLGLGVEIYGSQYKLSSHLTSFVFLLMIHTYVGNNKGETHPSILSLLGDYSFGIYICHVFLMWKLPYVPFYNELPFVLENVVLIGVSLLFVYAGDKICGPTLSKWFGFK